ncbi:MAG TPA: bifunctional phosphoribosylaminoimidazolecarboxamide formyltransferase/IMP cyclohydrolase, partial [Burkholderiaceae bacterium]
VIDPADYVRVLAEIDQSGATSYGLRLDLAKKVFAHTAAYDGAIANYLTSLTSAPAQTDVPVRAPYPDTLTIQIHKNQGMRYGENPHQSAAFYTDAAPAAGLLANYRQLQGKELSYNNIADADAAWECVKSFTAPACVIVKHANPCGVAVGANAAEAYSKAFKTDPTSAFGGIIAFNQIVDKAAAELVVKQFVEVLMAPGFTAEALAIFAPKVNVRLMEIALPPGGARPWDQGRNAMDSKRVGSGLLIQSADNHFLQKSDLKIVTQLQPTAQQLDDLMFAWTVAQYVKSNAIVFCGGGMTLGVGAGQMSRIDSARIASIKAANANLELTGSVVASDAFFPFRDGLDVLADAGASCVIQPGGSMRDDEVIKAADERGVAMVMTGVRHFRH